jgi:hypothetical protein
VAQAFSRFEGRPVEYHQVPWEEWEKLAGPGMTRMFRWLEEGGAQVDIDAVRQEYPAVTSFEKWMQTKLQPAAGAGGAGGA